MPRRPDTPCASCGRLLWSGTTSLPPGQRMCQPCRRNKPTPPKPERVCPCGAAFTPSGSQTYCSPACRPRRPSGARIRTYGEAPCEWCTTTFTRTSFRQRFCSTKCIGESKRSGVTSVIPWASCLDCRQWFVARGSRRTHGPSCPSRAKQPRPCQTCGQLIPPSLHGATIYCSRSCRTNSDAHRASRRAAKAKRRARERGARVETFDPQEVFERDQWICGLCNNRTLRTKAVPHPRAPTLDHIVPLAEGGEHSRANTQCACFLCNSIKGARATHPEQLRLLG